jgi:hypothetical protein
MPTYGVTAAGLVVKSMDTIETEIDDGLKTILGESAGSDPDGKIPLASGAGQLKSLLVDREAALWDILEAVYASLDPNQSTGASQDAVCSITGTIRAEEQFSTATVTCTGDPLTVLPVGRVVSVEDTGARFTSDAAATIAALTAWVNTTAYVVDDKVTNASRAYVCTVAGTSAGSGGPTTTDIAITDNTVTWRYLGEGTGAVDVAYTAEEAGEIGAAAYALTDIETPVDGWENATNIEAAIEGDAEESDSELRVRRDAELAAPGNTTPDAIRANILRVNDGSTDPDHLQPDDCHVFYNDTDYVDANGLPPHSVEVLVQGGTAADIAEEIWDSVGAGTYIHGTTSATVEDSEGNDQTVRYTRPTEVPIYVRVDITYDAAEWPASPSTVITQWVKSAVLTYAEDVEIGENVRAPPIIAAVYRGGAAVDGDSVAIVPAPDGSDPIPGVVDCTVYISTSPIPTLSTAITVTSRQLATFAAGNITVNATPETP